MVFKVIYIDIYSWVSLAASYAYMYFTVGV